jgi:hypothetical protein
MSEMQLISHEKVHSRDSEVYRITKDAFGKYVFS